MRLVLDNKIILIMIIGIISGLFSIYFFSDSKLVNEWPILLNNLETNKMLSVRSVDGVPVPNILMPPLYPFFLYLIKIPINEFLECERIIK